MCEPVPMGVKGSPPCGDEIFFPKEIPKFLLRGSHIPVPESDRGDLVPPLFLSVFNSELTPWGNILVPVRVEGPTVVLNQSTI